MADGTIKFDTELDSSGLEAGLGKLSDNSAAAMEKVSVGVNGELAKAFSELAGEAKAKAAQITSDAIAAEQLYESESDRIQNSKKKAEALYIEQLRDNVEKIKELRQQELKSLETSYELGLIDTEEYYTRLADFRDRYFAYGSVEWMNYTAEILEHNKKLADEQEKALSKAAQTTAENISDTFEQLEKQQTKLEEKLTSFGGISRKATITGDEKIEYVTLGNIEKQNEKLREYSSLLSDAQKRVADFWRTDTGDAAVDEKNAELRKSYFDQMRDMSVEEGIDFGRMLSATSDETLFGHLSAFEEQQRLADEISKSLYSTDVSDAADRAARNLGADFSSALGDELEGLSGKFFTSGESACKSFGEGFMASLEGVLAELSAGIAEGVAGLGYGQNGNLGYSQSSVENNTSYNIYGTSTPAETIRLLREREEIKQMMLD